LASTVLLGELHAERFKVCLVRGDLFAFEGDRDPWFAALETFSDDPLCQQELQELESELWATILAAAREGIGKFFKLRGEVHRAFPRADIMPMCRAGTGVRSSHPARVLSRPRGCLALDPTAELHLARNTRG